MERRSFFGAVVRSGIDVPEGDSSASASAIICRSVAGSGVAARRRTDTPSELNIPAGKVCTRLSTADRLDGTFRKRSKSSSESAEQKKSGSREGKNIFEEKT